MIKLFLCLLLLNSLSFSLDLTEDITPIHKEIDLLQPFKGNIDELLENQKDKFKTIEFFRRYLIKKYDKNDLWLRLRINHNQEHSIKRQFITQWKRVDIEFFLVTDKKIIHSEILKQSKPLQYSSKLTLLPNKNYDVYLRIKTQKVRDELYFLSFVSSEKMIDFMTRETRLYNHGVFFGIILTMMIYSFFMYFSMNMKCYLYLGLYQFSVLVYTSDIRGYLYFILQDFPVFSYNILTLSWSFIVMVLSIAFTREFLNTKETMPLFDKFLFILIVLLALGNLNGNSIEFGSSVLIVIIIAGIYSFIKGNLSALFYVFGFIGFASFMFFSNLSKYLGWDIYFEYHSVLQISTSIESFSLTFALYLKVKSLVKEKEQAQKEVIENEKMLLVQSRFASMGEMLASIAHQWRQPLNHLDMILGNILLAFETKKLDQKYLSKKSLEAHRQLKYMSDTIEDFSNFFTPKGKTEKFYLVEVCNYTLDLLKSRTIKHQIDIKVNIKEDKEHLNYKNELTQVFLIVLNNAIDALMFNNIENRKIDINVKQNEIIISDNAGGIPEDIINKIFDPYFSTKDKKFGTGLGLYTSKMIIENIIKGKLTVKNSDEGSSFTILIP